MKKSHLLWVAITSAANFFVANAVAETPIEMETRNGIVYKKSGELETHVRNGRVFVKLLDDGTTFATFPIANAPETSYALVARYKTPTILLKMQASDATPSIIPANKVDLILFQIYSQMNVAEILKQIKSYPDEDFNAVFLMLHEIATRVATVSDKRKIIDFFLEKYRLKYDSRRGRQKFETALKDRWFSFNLRRNPLAVCLANYAIEYAGAPLGMTTIDELKNVESQMLQNSVYSAPGSIESTAENKLVPAEIKILYYIYSKSILGKEQGIIVPETRFSALKKELGATHPGILTAKIQDCFLAGELRPEFAADLREIVDQNYEIALPIALDFSRKIKAWDDVAYYAYRCLKRDIYGIQKQFFRSELRAPYFDYLEFTLEGLAKTDAQAAGTLCEFIRALPQTTRQNLWLARAERILDGVDYDKNEAQAAGTAMAQKGFYENEKLEARFRESFEKRLKQN